ncbi:MAG TPA: class A beta-lactamase-related serine hydrolase [Candidatus Sphingobacterium stercoripullorum]|uniref:Class A beta-lactamase-related serine hydrolase n=1 Tax=Candidatus Sphingobacterium stercoripullorum TaxID=2838759 RepID=A0A9D1WAH7_9SPHI|nr:class A beta-lactamase-related serine hydrolase [Candidatus Sphingobacterium stercoripullorum]
MEQIAKIQEQIENKPWKTAITIYKNGKSIFENSLANTTYKSASLIKLAIALYIQEVKPQTINNEITLSIKNVVGGAGIINRLSIKTWKIRDLIDLMLSLSDNSATNALLSYYHLDNINSFPNKIFKISH